MRTREEINEELHAALKKMGLMVNITHVTAKHQEYMLEVLLDIRDILAGAVKR